ncbi:MAG: cytochrome c biogenesis protein CcdA [Sphingobacteriaceae bacterium]
MKKLFGICSLTFIFFTSFGQILDPVKWRYSSEKLNDKEANLVITADIEKGWHIYSMFIEDGGPIATSFKFEPSAHYKLLGKMTESPAPKVKFDNSFKMNIATMETQAVFKQKIKLNKSGTIINGSLEFMVCDDKQCLPPDERKFTIEIKNENPLAAVVTKPIEKIPDPTVISQTSRTVKETDTIINVKKEAAAKAAEGPDITPQKESLWGIFIAGFLGGLAAFFMPCIYPMIPLTVSYFTKKGGSRSGTVLQAAIYGLSIIIIYVILGLAISKLFGSDALNDLATNAVFNIIFFLLLLVFAISFFGVFDITLPSSWVNKMDAQSDKGGLLGLFFMAFTLALVSFSCTGPIIGTLLVDSVTKGAVLGPAAGMFGFSAALAIPFTLFALFPSWLSAMPKSGGWLNTVKVSLGFLELALSLKFLSVVDMAYGWHILDREIFLAIWIVIFALFGFYLLGKIKFSQDSELKFISVPRLFFAILIFSFTVYLIPGMWGAPLKSISGLLPLPHTQDFDLSNKGESEDANNAVGFSGNKKYADRFHAPYGLDAFFDFDQGMAYAQQMNKPVLIDFTGWACANCRDMESKVWTEPDVLSRLKNDFVLIQLYVDEKKTVLPANEQYISTLNNKKIVSLGNKWSDLQATKYGANSQPYYVVTDQDGKPLVKPLGKVDRQTYIEFLDSGKAAYYKKNDSN